MADGRAMWQEVLRGQLLATTIGLSQKPILTDHLLCSKLPPPSAATLSHKPALELKGG